MIVLATIDPDAGPPPCSVIGLLVLAERLRPHIRDTVAFFRSQGVELKVLSGDNPQTVAAIADDVGIDVRSPRDGRELPDDPEALCEVARETTVIGRISPEGKRAVVESLRDAGRYVAMVGDGVNDVPALKAARLAIAQGTGTQMARGVADLVLIDGEFGAVPALVHQGRQALRNLQRVSRLYLAKSSFAAFLILVIGTTSTAYPLLPRHLSLAAAITIGIPTFVLALAPSTGAWHPAGFVRSATRFALPAGFIVGVGVVASYLFALHNLGYRVPEARVIATTVLVIAGLYLVYEIEGGSLRRRTAVGTMCFALIGLYVAAILLPATRHFFKLEIPTLGMTLTALVGAAVAIGALYLSGFPTHDGDGRARSGRARAVAPAVEHPRRKTGRERQPVGDEPIGKRGQRGRRGGNRSERQGSGEACLDHAEAARCQRDLSKQLGGAVGQDRHIERRSRADGEQRGVQAQEVEDPTAGRGRDRLMPRAAQ
jgi:magnesium-transporting ATPase (P-type)